MKELCDVLYVTIGTAVAMGLDIEPFFEEVHKANMSKLEGVVETKDGKVQKSDTYRPPQLELLEPVMASF